jgi:hypothetical protein
VITEVHITLILRKRSLELIQEPHNTLGDGICSYLAIVLDDHDAKNETNETNETHKIWSQISPWDFFYTAPTVLGRVVHGARAVVS